MSAFLLVQVVGYLAIALPGRPSYSSLEPTVWVVMDFFVFVTLALAADLPFARWVARIASLGLVVAIAVAAKDEGVSIGWVVLLALASTMLPTALLVRPRERAASDAAVGTAEPAR